MTGLEREARQQLQKVTDILRALRDEPWEVEFTGDGKAEGNRGVIVAAGGQRITLDLLIDLARGSLDGQVWIVGQNITEDLDSTWEFQGVFHNQFLAEQACQNRFWFVGPARMNAELPSTPETWPGFYRPNDSEPVAHEARG